MDTVPACLYVVCGLYSLGYHSVVAYCTMALLYWMNAINKCAHVSIARSKPIRPGAARLPGRTVQLMRSTRFAPNLRGGSIGTPF